MNITELEKITKQIKKYQLEDEIGNVEWWLMNLNEKQIGNFLSLDIYPTEQIFKFKSLLVNAIALNGNYYLEDINLVKDAKNDKIANYLISVACFPQSEHHREDMKLIANTKNDIIAWYLKVVAKNINSLESEHHTGDMELISIIKDTEISKYLTNVACSKNSLESKYHREDMKRLANVKDDKDANEIYDNIIKQYEVKNKKDDVIYNIIKQYKVKNKKEESNYETFQEKIDAIHQNAIEYTDGDTTKELNDSVFTLK